MEPKKLAIVTSSSSASRLFELEKNTLVSCATKSDSPLLSFSAIIIWKRSTGSEHAFGARWLVHFALLRWGGLVHLARAPTVRSESLMMMTASCVVALLSLFTAKVTGLLSSTLSLWLSLPHWHHHHRTHTHTTWLYTTNHSLSGNLKHFAWFRSKSTSSNCPYSKNSTRESNQHHREKITKPPQKI